MNKIIMFIVYLIYILIRSNETIHMLQQNKYNAKKTYLKWMKRNIKKCFYIEDLFFLLLIIIKKENIIILSFIIIYTVLIIKRLFTKRQNKLPLKYTSRVKRLIFTNMLIHIIPIILLYKENIQYTFILLGFISFINSLYVLIAVLINTPVEKLVGYYYKTKAKNKLKNMNNLKVIGITGSYGKTSSKNILNDILNIKYNSMPTPKNYNTPFGLMITINNYLDKFTDVFIAEMGACQEYDIDELCKLVRPKYGIITRIGVAHLATFGSREKIQKTKFELIENLPKDGVGILNGDDEWQRSYKIKNNCKIKWIGIDSEDVDVRAQDITLSPEGTKFNLVLKGDNNKYPFQTKLLGYANVYNILSSIALGLEFGMTIEQLKAGVAKVKAVEHRLELKKQGDITIIDDAYNSNPLGSKMALDVLKMMPGKHIVVTPGMVELGKEEDKRNKEFGRQISASADEVILVGKEKTKPIYEGLIEKEKETYVLLENDLPDIFNEK